MEIRGTVFLLQLVVFLGLLALKAYAVMTHGRPQQRPLGRSDFWNSYARGVMFFIIGTLAYGLGLISSVLMVDEYFTNSLIIFSQIFQLESWLFVVFFILFLIETIFLVRDLAVKNVEAHMTMR